jgi:hypothetical protein
MGGAGGRPTPTGRDCEDLMTELQHDGARPNGSLPAEAGRGAIAALAADPARRAEARRRVEETPDSYHRIARDLAVPPGSLHRYAALSGWTRPPEAPKAAVRAAGAPPGRRRLASTLGDAETVMGRIVRAVDRQLGKVETRLGRKGSDIEEKDARILGTLAKTLATLMALERDGGAKARETEPVDREQLNADLARRIARWAEGREGSE